MVEFDKDGVLDALELDWWTRCCAMIWCELVIISGTVTVAFIHHQSTACHRYLPIEPHVQ